MILAGILLFVLGLILAVKILWILGVIALAIGCCLALAGALDHGAGGRRHWY